MASTAYHNLSRRELRTQLEARDSQLEAKDRVIQSKEAQLKAKDQVIRMLKASIANLKRMLFGHRSERFIAPVESGEQGERFPGMSTVDPPPAPPKPPAAPSAPKRKPRRRPCLTGLRVIELVIEPEEDVSGGQRLSDKIRDVLVRIPAQAYCLRIIQRRYRHEHRHRSALQTVDSRGIGRPQRAGPGGGGQVRGSPAAGSAVQAVCSTGRGCPRPRSANGPRPSPRHWNRSTNGSSNRCWKATICWRPTRCCIWRRRTPGIGAGRTGGMRGPTMLRN